MTIRRTSVLAASFAVLAATGCLSTGTLMWDPRIHRSGDIEYIAPKDQSGLLTNRRRKSVTFVIKGKKSLTVTVPAGSSTRVELPPGRYQVEVYRANSRWAYIKENRTINSTRNDGSVDGEVCDFSMIAR